VSNLRAYETLLATTAIVFCRGNSGSHRLSPAIREGSIQRFMDALSLFGQHVQRKMGDGYATKQMRRTFVIFAA
jgi:hypothetical protein